MKEGYYTFHFGQNHTYHQWLLSAKQVNRINKRLCRHPDKIFETESNELLLAKENMSIEFQDCMRFYNNNLVQMKKKIKCRVVRSMNCTRKTLYREGINCTWEIDEPRKIFKIKITGNVSKTHDNNVLITIPNFTPYKKDIIGYLSCSIHDALYYQNFFIEEPFVLREHKDSDKQHGCNNG